MLQAHSFVWYYLWVAPNILLLFLGLLVWKRKLSKLFPAFSAFAILGAAGHLALITSDVVPSVTPEIFWLVDWASLVIDGVVKFVLIGEIFAQVFGSYERLARLGRLLIRIVGAALVLAGALAAAYAPQDGRFGIVSGAHLLEQTIYFVESGVLLFIFLFSAYFRLSWNRQIFGITLGLSVSACVHLATWAILANGGLPEAKRGVLNFVNMATHHVCVLIWFYYLLFPGKSAPKLKQPSLPEHNLGAWNRELERLVHK